MSPNLNDAIRHLSFRAYESPGNPPRTLSDFLLADGGEIEDFNLKDIEERVHELIRSGPFYLLLSGEGKFIKSYRIEEICQRTIDKLRGTMHPAVENLLDENPMLLHEEFSRWLSLGHREMMSSIIDHYWHMFMIFSYEYRSWCFDNYGRFIHHVPTTYYEKISITPEQVIKSNLHFFNKYRHKYEVTESILLYSLPYKLLVDQGLSSCDIISMIRDFPWDDGNSHQEDNALLDAERNLRILVRTRKDLDENGFAHIKQKISLNDFCEICEQIGTVVNISNINIDPSSHKKFNMSSGLDLHTDAPTVRYVCWFCVRQDDVDGTSLLIDCSDVLDTMDHETLDTLHDIRINFPIYKRIKTSDHPILRKQGDHTQLYYTSWLLKPEYTEQELSALKRFQDYVKKKECENTIAIRLLPGESLIIDNHRMLHGRNTISESSDRYLYRIHLA